MEMQDEQPNQTTRPQRIETKRTKGLPKHGVAHFVVADDKKITFAQQELAWPINQNFSFCISNFIQRALYFVSRFSFQQCADITKQTAHTVAIQL